jgi:hypothetical protein
LGSKIAISLSLVLHEGRTRYRRTLDKPSALKREHPALQNMKILNFFLYLRVVFALLDLYPDPATQINADPDPQPFLPTNKIKIFS